MTLRDVFITIPPMWNGMGTWAYSGEKEVEPDSHNAKMWHYLIAPDGTKIDINQYFGSYYIPKNSEIEDLITELPEVRRHLGEI
tara:strand:+ start:216 stop:467 length:252 start_codon:yes stop_codon:yes gene_type:complete